MPYDEAALYDRQQPISRWSIWELQDAAIAKLPGVVQDIASTICAALNWQPAGLRRSDLDRCIQWRRSQPEIVDAALASMRQCGLIICSGDYYMICAPAIEPDAA